MEALSAHESVPGHHLQGAVARELENVPPFRLNFYPHAFGEGWGLYSEWLGQEMGMYHTPYERFGRLTYEMWRACRLVVDTGMHALGWTRQQAIDFMLANTSSITSRTCRCAAFTTLGCGTAPSSPAFAKATSGP